MKIKFEKRDAWIGVYWNKVRVTTLETDRETLTVYVCIVPFFPLVFSITKGIPRSERSKNW